MDTWYMGIHRAYWLSRPELADVAKFVSRRVFPKGDFPPAYGPFGVDSGGFTELQLLGGWKTTAVMYVAFLRKVWAQCGPFDFAAPQDWMCEDIVIKGGQAGPLRFKGTGLSVRIHQELTTGNLLELRGLAPELPIIPVVQGQRVQDYIRHVHMYADAGIDLTREPLVGVGSVCRRQHMDEAIEIMQALRDLGIPRLHGFGFKIEGLRACWNLLHTADSMAWSFDGRHAGPCQHPPYATGKQPQSEANCLSYALEWRRQHIRPPRRTPTRQMSLFDVGVAA
ncbi:deazapurine DNA modification protein DpdA family protein [Micromonospora sediminicola]